MSRSGSWSSPSRFWRFHWATLALAIFVLAAPFAGAWAKAPRLRVHFFAVGQGDAALITGPTGKTILVDGGPRGAAARLSADLKAKVTGPLDLVLLTHRHADHLGGLPLVIDATGARLFMDGGFPHPSPAYAELLDVLERHRVPLRQARAGRAIDLGGGARLLLLTPPEPPLSRTRSDVNANSVLFRLEFGTVRILFAADAERATEAWLLQHRAGELRAQVLKVAHHGSRHSSTAPFLRAVRAEMAVISVGEGNPYGHPAAETLDRLSRGNTQVFRTDRQGTVTLETDGQSIQIQTERPRTPQTTRRHPVGTAPLGAR